MGDLWHQSTVKTILSNEVYTGNLVQNKSEVIDIRTGTRKEFQLINNLLLKILIPTYHLEGISCCTSKAKTKGKIEK
ncbi:recombinase family protein [Cytobacillus praedii]|uniref:recombinase family protein n=1 Tax=Cytobacillus praedii TaxID=1742358 RepID=UPI000708B919|nr:recombinase family protein [Cytobacillus praedii]